MQSVAWQMRINVLTELETMKKWIKAHSRILKITVVSLLLAHALSGVIILPPEIWKWGFYVFATLVWISVLLYLTGVISKIVEWWDKE